MEANNLVISDGERSYKILKPIGTWGPDFSLIVYEALVLDSNNKVPHVAFKMIKETDDLQDFHEMVVDDVNRSTDFSAHGCRYILPIFKSFYSEIDGDLTLCIVLPFDSHVVSLRSLLSDNPSFTGGLHDKFIGIVLARVLKALRKVHKKGNHHMQITAGNIFYNYRSDTIQLAYAASVYERDTTLDDDGTVCSVNKMLAWALAPEVNDEESMEFVDNYDTEKSDIWLVGIAALELAYGKIQVRSRRELLEIASYISEVKILPNTWEELRQKSAELIADRALPIKKRRFGNGSHTSNTALSTETERRLSACFGSFVATCLDTDVNMRASAKQLKKHVFLKKNVGSLRYFRDVIVKEKNPHVARFLIGGSKRK
ncbi:Protein kinase domain-containing protein [Heracleum sosnowskyi]|uniref:Protein kinase domain-containing protein n=1 Tax=Heracleum sosnowskyi TaxID=360622 RepID=A0AAD8H7N8_9APIA|nr:Protein kinase domain-containing protein [Heracleum sosnowskyi]